MKFCVWIVTFSQCLWNLITIFQNFDFKPETQESRLLRGPIIKISFHWSKNYRFSVTRQFLFLRFMIYTSFCVLVFQNWWIINNRSKTNSSKIAEAVEDENKKYPNKNNHNFFYQRRMSPRPSNLCSSADATEQ